MGRSVFENDGIAGADFSQFLIGIDLEPVTGEGPYFVILVLEIQYAVIVLKGPEEWEAVGAVVFVPGVVFFEGARAICPEDDGIIFFKTNDTGVEGIEVGGVVIIRLGVETSFFITPRGIGEQFRIVPGRSVTAAQRKADRNC